MRSSHMQMVEAWQQPLLEFCDRSNVHDLHAARQYNQNSEVRPHQLMPARLSGLTAGTAQRWEQTAPWGRCRWMTAPC